MRRFRQGFTLIELLVVIAIIGILSSIVMTSLNSSREKAYLAKAKVQFRNIRTALEMYADDNNGSYPPDAARDVSPGLDPYISSGWPKAPWPGSVYDWDNWDDPDNLGQKIYQISVRFCPAGGALSTCNFPPEIWAASFGVDSAVYYCVSGVCRAHASQPIGYPGYCVNC